ncbi:MAG: MarC family protein [Putridiphycobacter sp.]|nr:MarC family protein [Putridiphycobacter sp.]
MDKIDYIQIGKAFMILFAVIDIVGSIPVIIKIKEKAGDIHPLRASLVAFGLMIAFLFAGEILLGVLGVDIKAFAVAGSLILFALAVELIFGIELFKAEDFGSKIVAVVPIAFPLIAGAGTMTTLISLRVDFDAINIVIAVFLNMILVLVVLSLTKQIERFLGPGGIAVLKKAFGIILLAIAVKLFTENIQQLFY